MRGLLVTIAVIAAGCWFVSVDRPYATEQTWPSSYATTSCADWRTEMTDAQRQAAAADLLGERLQVRGVTEPPRLRQVTDWTEALDRACADDPRRTVEEAQLSLTA